MSRPAHLLNAFGLGLSVVTACFFTPLSAQTPPSAPPMAEWDALSQTQRDALIAPMRDRWNANPQERKRLWEHAQRWNQMPPQLRQRARHGMHRWEDMPPAERAQMRELFERTRSMPRQQRHETFILFRQMRAMTPIQRDALVDRWRTMTPAQRDAWLREHALRQEWQARPQPAHD